MNWSVILTSMLPEHLLLVGMLAILGLEIRSGHSRDGFALAVLSVGAAAAAALWLFVTGYLAEPFPQHFLVDPASSLSKAVLIALALPVLLISRDDFAETPYYTLVLASLYGACLLVSSTSFPTLFLGIEIMSLPVYALVLLGLLRAQSTEAALKYLVLGGAATATLLMGISLLYGWSGS
ncbi:MAG: NADH-quinone oxidoreductase subunit, partial [Pseudomonadota bacterium]|nr:NADH-quinone oxidoreductase subunit [Pseudomonadota bacterium]